MNIEAAERERMLVACESQRMGVCLPSNEEAASS